MALTLTRLRPSAGLCETSASSQPRTTSKVNRPPIVYLLSTSFRFSGAKLSPKVASFPNHYCFGRFSSELHISEEGDSKIEGCAYLRAFEFAREIIHAPARRTNNFVLWYRIICAPRTNNSVLWYKIIGAPTKLWPPLVQG